MNPEWATFHNETHVFVPPHFGRGNHHDGWTPMCGRGLEIAPWIERRLEMGKQRCLVCVQITNGVHIPSATSGITHIRSHVEP